MLYTDRKRAFSWMLLLSALFYLGLQINGVSYMLTDTENDALTILDFASSLGFASPLMPLIAALPFAASFCMDYKSGYTVPVALRAGKRRQLLSKSLAVAISGGLAVALGTLLFIVLLNVRFPPDITASPEYMNVNALVPLLQSGPRGEYSAVGNYIVYYVARLFLLFLSGAFWALMALCFSAFYPDLSLTLCVPLVVQRLMQELSELTFIPPHLNPILLEGAHVDLSPAGALGWGFAVYGALCLVLALVFIWRAGRRLSYA